MRFITNLLKILVGLLFIFSGFIKSNDPIGFSYKLDEYFSVFSADLEPVQDSIQIELSNQNQNFSHKESLNAYATNYTITTFRSPWKIHAEAFQTEITILLHNQKTLSWLLEVKDTSNFDNQALMVCRIKNQEVANQSIKIDLDTVITSLDMGKYIKPNGSSSQFFKKIRPYSLSIGIVICILEIILGMALIIGFAPRVTISSILILTILFTFLTWYSAYFGKVTDCGCFGDAIKLSPWQSFYKDIIILGASIIILFGIRYIKSIFYNAFAIKVIIVIILISVSFSMYCVHYLPIINFLKFKKGNDIYKLATIPKGAPVDVYENIFIYAKNGKEEKFTLSELSKRNLQEEGYLFVDRIDKLISKGYEPEIHDFKLMDESKSNDYIDDFYADSSYKLLIVFNDIEKAEIKNIEKLKKLITQCQVEDISLYPITASDSKVVNQFRATHDINIPFYYGDKTNLKSIIRSNPGIVLLHGNMVIENWPNTRLPSSEKIKRIIAR
jgi:uncharacterized membrane protein YphA (DoxX/SURF4 family)